MYSVAAAFFVIFIAACAGVIKPYIGKLTRWQFAVAAIVSFLLVGVFGPKPEDQPVAPADDDEIVADGDQSTPETTTAEDEAPETSTVAERAPVPTEEDLSKRIGADAISSYSESDRQHYPKMFERLGNRVFEVESLGTQAALLALRTGKCDRVLFVDVSSRSSRDDLQFYVDCNNETRVRVSEAQIAAGEVESAETSAERSRRVAARDARNRRLVSDAKSDVRAVLRDPSSAEFGNVYVSEKDGLVTCGFVNARNGFGGMTGQQPFIAFRNRVANPTDANFEALWEKHCAL